MYDSGVTFRVWAPFASRVSVAGTFNNWSNNSHQLFSEGNGYWSVDVDSARLGDQYKYVLTNRDHGWELWRNDPYARELTNSAGNSIVADPDFNWTAGEYSTPLWNEVVIYELHIGTFSVDTNRQNGRGSFQSAIGKLDYLQELGINAVEIMAAGEFPVDSSWGYNQSYMFAIEQSYGGPNGFRDFVDQAHRRGIAVIFDVVYNHIGPRDLDLWQFDGWEQDNHGGIYFYNDWRRNTPWGETRPDYGRSEVRQYLRDNALRWLEQRHVDGLRWDATGWIRNVEGKNNDPGNDLPDGWGLMQLINGEIRSRQSWKISIAEDMQNNEWITRDVESGGAGFNAQWDAGFVHPVRAAIVSPNDNDRNMYAIRDAITHAYNDDAFRRVVYTESHDEDANGRSRIPEEIWPGNAGSYYSKKRSILGATLVLTAPGIPMIFQGQEFLEAGYFSDERMLDWTKAERYRGILNFYRDLIRLRRNWFDTTRGLRGQHTNVFHVNNSDKVIAFHRWDRGGPGDDVVIVINMANRSYENYSLGLPREGTWRVRLNSDWRGYSEDFGNHVSEDIFATPPGRDFLPAQSNLSIGALSALILSQ